MTLDYSRIRTPREHGEVLVVPEPSALVRAVSDNSRLLRQAGRPLCGRSLPDWRKAARMHFVGDDDRPVIVIGHDPGFIHPGVWAKYVVASRLAEALDGIAVNVVVDSHAPRETFLSVPRVSGNDVSLRSLPFAQAASSLAFEQLSVQSPEAAEQFGAGVREAMGDRYSASQMPRFFNGFFATNGARDWVDQSIAGRRAVETTFGVCLRDLRVSESWPGPFLLDMLARAGAFAACYNAALAEYRRRFGVRSSTHPMPDLYRGDDHCELAVWVYREGEPRQRAFMARAGNTIRLFTPHGEIGTVHWPDLQGAAGLDALAASLPGWRIRPRAIPLTIWARLLLADLFLHGVGGARYDWISDAIIADYYGVQPPEMGCISATLHLDLPRTSTTAETVRRLAHGIRDLRYNPQRNLPSGSNVSDALGQRAKLVARGRELALRDPGNRAGRRTVFNEIRRVNAEVLQFHPDILPAWQQALADATVELRQNRFALGREHFFSLYDTSRLETLLDALPQQRAFQV